MHRGLWVGVTLWWWLNEGQLFHVVLAQAGLHLIVLDWTGSWRLGWYSNIFLLCCKQCAWDFLIRLSC